MTPTTVRSLARACAVAMCLLSAGAVLADIPPRRIHRTHDVAVTKSVMRDALEHITTAEEHLRAAALSDAADMATRARDKLSRSLGKPAPGARPADDPADDRRAALTAAVAALDHAIGRLAALRPSDDAMDADRKTTLRYARAARKTAAKALDE